MKRFSHALSSLAKPIYKFGHGIYFNFFIKCIGFHYLFQESFNEIGFVYVSTP